MTTRDELIDGTRAAFREGKTSALIGPQREYLDVAVGETITLVGPIEVEFLDRVDGSRMGVASAPDGVELKLTGIESARFAKVVTDPFVGLDVPFTDQ